MALSSCLPAARRANGSGLSPSLNAMLEKDDHILIEYPMPQRKRTYAPYLFSLLRRVKFYALIHDLNSLRYDSPQSREVAILKLFDGLISHNPTMTRWLRDGGLSARIVELQLFDYCTDAAEVWHEDDISLPLQVVLASNLSYDKARYVYDPQLGTTAQRRALAVRGLLRARSHAGYIDAATWVHSIRTRRF